MMLIEDRFENKLLKRVELRFKVNHPNATTPSRAKLMEMVKQMEPGATKDLIIIKDVSTRFGQPLTTGLAFIYEHEEALSIEPTYIQKRHASLRSGAGSQAQEDGGDA